MTPLLFAFLFFVPFLKNWLHNEIDCCERFIVSTFFLYKLSRQALACAHRDNVSDGEFIALVSAKFHVMHISRLLSATAIGDECMAKSRQLHDTFRWCCDSFQAVDVVNIKDLLNDDNGSGTRNAVFHISCVCFNSPCASTGNVSSFFALSSSLCAASLPASNISLPLFMFKWYETDVENVRVEEAKIAIYCSIGEGSRDVKKNIYEVWILREMSVA